MSTIFRTATIAVLSLTAASNAARADELPTPAMPVTTLNERGGYFLNPAVWTFLSHFLSGSNTVARRIATSPGASYFQDGRAHATRNEIDPRRPFCKLVIVNGEGHPPGETVVIKRDAHLVLREGGVTTRTVLSPNGEPSHVETTIAFNTGESTDNDAPDPGDDIFPELWGLECRSSELLTIGGFVGIIGLHLYHQGWNPYHLIATSKIDSEGSNSRSSVAAPSRPDATSGVASSRSAN